MATLQHFVRRCSSRFRSSSLPFTITPIVSKSSSSITSTNTDKNIKEDNTTAKSIISLLKSEKDPGCILSICEPIIASSHRHSISHLHRSALSIVVSSLSSSNSVSSIHSLLFSFPIHHAIVLYGEAHMIDDALSTFHSYIKSISNNSKAGAITRSFNAVLFACIVSNNHKFVPNLVRYSGRCIHLDLTTYNTLLKSYCQSGSSMAAYSVFDEISRKIVKLNLTSFTNALTGLYRDGHLQLVNKLLVLMKKHGCHPGLSVYNIRIQCLRKLGKVDEAKDLLYKEMRQRGIKPNWVTYDHLILGFCSVGDLEGAKSIFKEMIKRGYLPGSSSCYFSFICYLCKGGDFEYALDLARDCVDQNNWMPCFSTMKELVLGLVGVGKISDALEILGNFAVRDEFDGESNEDNAVLPTSRIYGIDSFRQ